MDHILQCHEIVKTDFVRAEKCALYDQSGKRYVDLESGIWCTALGHNHPRLTRVIEAQIEQVMHLGTRTPHALAEALALDLLEVLGLPDGKCTFLSSGSEAVEFAARTARLASGRHRLLTFQNSYLSAYGSTGRKDPDEWLSFDWNAPGRTDPCAGLDEIPFEEIGGFVFEPGGSGIAFVHFPPAALVQEIVRRVREAGGLVVVNEVTTGMGRTGKWFGFQHYGLQPDVVAAGKGLGNGYPVSAVAMRREVAEALEADGFHYAQSHQNDPLGCAVAREVIAIFREGGWVERGAAVGKTFLEGLKQLERKHALVKEVRGRGMLLGMEFQPHERLTAAWAYRALLEAGYLAGYYYPAGNLLRFDPALTIEQDDLDQLLVCLDGILHEVVVSHY